MKKKISKIFFTIIHHEPPRSSPQSMSSQVTVLTGRKRTSSSGSTLKRSKTRRSTKKSATPRVSYKNLSYVNFGRTIPTTLTATHRYCVPSVQSATSAGGTAQIFWKCNSMYDPEDAVGGHQPYLFDQLGALYEHFTVVASKLSIVLTPLYDTATNPGDFWTFALMLNSDASMAGGVQTMIEQGQNVSWANTGKNSDMITLRSSWDIRKQFGVKTYQEAVGLSRFQGTTSSDCSELTHYLLAAQNNSGSQGRFSYTVVIDYVAIWSEPKDAASS